jgi:anti-sigma B factor antagonist
VRGEVDLSTGPLLWERISAVIAGGSTRVVLDLAGMAFIDSTGLSVLVMAMRRLQEVDGQLVLRSPCRMASRLLQLTGLSQLLEVEGDVALAG